MIERKAGSIPPTSAKPPRDAHEPQEDEKFSGWPFVWILFGFKFVVIVATYYFATRSTADISILVATHWIWIGVPVAALIGPFVFRRRLHRVRRKRDQLQASEWMTDDADHD